MREELTLDGSSIGLVAGVNLHEEGLAYCDEVLHRLPWPDVGSARPLRTLGITSCSRGEGVSTTGRAGLRARLEKLGYELSKVELDQAYQRFLTVADKKQEVFDEDLMALLHQEAARRCPEAYQLDYLHMYSGTSAIPTATVRLRVKGETRTGASIGNGPQQKFPNLVTNVQRYN